MFLFQFYIHCVNFTKFRTKTKIFAKISKDPIYNPTTTDVKNIRMTEAEVSRLARMRDALNRRKAEAKFRKNNLGALSLQIS